MALATIKRSKLGKATKTKLEQTDEETDGEQENSLNDVNEESPEEENESNDEQEEDNTPSEDNESSDEQEEGNTGWADSIAKVLSSTKPKTKKSVVLSRAKKLETEKEKIKKEKTDYGFEIEGEIKEEKPIKEELKEKSKERKNLKLPLRVRPTWKDIERERTLRKVATRGVVQLFNAVRMQQKDLQHQLDEAGPLDSRKDAVLNNINKKKFLDVLMSGNRAKSEAVDNSLKIEKEEETSDEESDQDGDNVENGRKRKSEWSVLRPDFMTNKKIKHWDEEDEDSDENKADSNDDTADDEE